MFDAILERNAAVRAIQSRAAIALDAWGVTADRATAAGLAAGVIAGLCFGAGRRNCGILMLVVSAGLDALDGTIARQHGSPSALGGIFDLCADRVVEVMVLLGIVWRRPALYFPALMLTGSWYVNITAFLATGTILTGGAKLIAYPPGLVERTEAIIFFVLLAMAPTAGPVLCYGYALLEVATALQRVRFVRRALE